MITIRDIISEVEDMRPYKERGNPDSYSSYNEGWSDACGTILSFLDSGQQQEESNFIVQPQILKKINLTFTKQLIGEFGVYLIEKNGKLYGEYKGTHFDLTVEEVEHNQ